MALTSEKISPREPERKMQELLNEWLRSYFTGVPHASKLGEVTFPLVDLRFNQTSIDNPDGTPQIHCVFSGLQPVESWFATGHLFDWSRTLARPFSGVAYGETGSQVEESVHGKSARRIRGRDIRWRADGAGLFEEVLRGYWEAVREFPGADAIRWRREAGSYVEEVRDATTQEWATARTIMTSDPLWDGTKKVVVVSSTILIFVRTSNAGQSGESGEFVCRRVADQVRELFEDEVSRGELTQRGFRRARVLAGPTPLASSGFQTRQITVDANLRYFTPREH